MSPGEEIQQARVDIAQANYDFAKFREEKLRKLSESGSVSEMEVIQAGRDLRIADAELRIAQWNQVLGRSGLSYLSPHLPEGGGND